jgi:hypothetical protein
MGLCRDAATGYLKGLGYNVVRHPREGISPLALIGRQRGTNVWLGGLEKLLLDPSEQAPAVETGLQAAAINGQQSSRLKMAVGVHVLGSLVGSMGGGNIGTEAGYTNARKLSFLFEGILTDRVEPLAVDHYLTGARINADGPLLAEYILGNGDLFLITDTVKASRFTVKYETHDGVDAKVDLPALSKVVGANVSVSAAEDSSGSVTYDGQKHLVFGFRCLELGVLDGDLRLTTVEAGAVPLAVPARVPDQGFRILTGEGEGLLDLDDSSAAVGAPA